MTIRLLSPCLDHLPDTLLSLTPETEAALVSAGAASFDLAGGVAAASARPALQAALRTMAEEGGEDGAVDGSGLTDALLTALGCSRADVTALPAAMKDCAPWLVNLRAVDNGQLDSTTYGISASKYKLDYQGFVGENVCKWVITEAVEGVQDYSRFDLLQGEMAAVGAVNTYFALHTVLGNDTYNPPWVVAGLAANPARLGSMVTGRVNAVIAKFGSLPLYRIDVMNECFGSAASNTVAANYVDNRGWRLTSNSMYTASVATNPANPAQFIWDAFVALKVAFPNAKLCWNDYGQELVQPNDSYFRGVLPPFYRTLAKTGSTISATDSNAFLTGNNFQGWVAKVNRMRYEIFKAKAAGVPVDVIGFQYHVVIVAPPNFDDFVMSLQDYNRWGVEPAVTELNAHNQGSLSADNVPPHLTFVGDALNRYAAYVAAKWLEQILTYTPCREVTFWSTAPDSETATSLDTNYPLRAAAMLMIKRAKAPAARTLKRGSRINCRFVLPLWVTNSAGGMTNLTQSTNRLALAASTQLTVDWSWFNASWMALPIAAADLILSAQFQVSAAIAGNAVLMGYGNAASGNSVLIIASGLALRIELTVAGALVYSAPIISAMTVATDYRVAVRINNNYVSASINGAAPTAGTASASFSNQDKVYLLSKADGSNWDAKLSAYFFEVHHGADYNSNALLSTLSVPLIRDISIDYYSGN